MKDSRILIRIFVTLLRLYPVQFRSEFEEEMQTVFAAKVLDQTRTNQVSLTATCLQDYFDLLYNLPEAYLTGFGKGEGMSPRNRILLFLSGCLFLAGGIFPWASLVSASTVESYNVVNRMHLYLTGGLMFAVSFITLRYTAKSLFILSMVIGLGWGLFTSYLPISYFINQPRIMSFLQGFGITVFIGPGLVLTMGASILSFWIGLSQLLSKNKRPNSLTISSS